MRLPIILILFLLSMLTACSENDETEITDTPIVVEGYIENGKAPIVVLSNCVNLEQNNESNNATVILWAKVTVYCDNDSIVLSCKYDKKYTLKYIYTTTYMKGELGKTYRLKIEYNNKTWTATTSIPSSLPIVDSLTVDKSQTNDSLYEVKAHIFDNLRQHKYYKISTMLQDEDYTWGTPMLACFDNEVFSKEHNEVPVYHYNNYIKDIEKLSPFFKENDNVYVRLANIDSTSFKFWQAYDNAINLGKNMMFQSQTNLPSNVTGARGQWTGLAASQFYVEIKSKEWRQIK